MFQIMFQRVSLAISLHLARLCAALAGMALLMSIAGTANALSNQQTQEQQTVTGAEVQALFESGQPDAAKAAAADCQQRSDDQICAYFVARFSLLDRNTSAAKQIESLRLLRRASAANVSSADVLLGLFHAHGKIFAQGGNVEHSIEKDINQAVTLWTKAAQNCNAWAQNKLGQLYYFGTELPRDLSAAYYWISIAAAYNFPNAAKGQEVMRTKISPKLAAETELAVAQFKQVRGCGSRKPVVFDHWELELQTP